jgi:hypothetical protein
VTVRVSVPTERLLAGIVKVKAPAESVCTDEVYPPPARVTVPVGAAPPLAEAATVTGTLRAELAVSVD